VNLTHQIFGPCPQGFLAEETWAGMRQGLAKSTEGFSGAEIAGLVRSATSYGLNRHLEDEKVPLSITGDDFDRAVYETDKAREKEAERERAEGGKTLMAFLEGLRLGDGFDAKYAAMFDEHHIGLIELDDLDHDLLREMGVASVGHRIQILNARDARY
jgi:hypothetical protein